MSAPRSDRLAGQVGTERLGIGTGDIELDAGDGLAGEPADLVDVGAAGRDPASDGGDHARGERVAEDGDVQPAAAPDVLA